MMFALAKRPQYGTIFFKSSLYLWLSGRAIWGNCTKKGIAKREEEPRMGSQPHTERRLRLIRAMRFHWQLGLCLCARARAQQCAGTVPMFMQLLEDSRHLKLLGAAKLSLN